MKKPRIKRSQWAEIDVQILKHRIIPAIKMYRDRMGAKLRDSKNAIERRRRVLERRGLLRNTTPMGYKTTLKGLRYIDSIEPGYLANRVLEDL